MFIDMLGNILLLCITYITYVGRVLPQKLRPLFTLGSDTHQWMALSKSLDLSGSQFLHPSSDRGVVLLRTFPSLTLPLLHSENLRNLSFHIFYSMPLKLPGYTSLDSS